MEIKNSNNFLEPKQKNFQGNYKIRGKIFKKLSGATCLHEGLA
jgi:hypothetical protein